MQHTTVSERLIEAMDQTRRQWELHKEAETGTTASAVFAPAALTIAISQETGANGSLIAHAVGDRLGWPVYDRELLNLVAQEMGLRAGLLEGVDERQRGWFEEYIEGFFAGPTVSETKYVRHLLETMLSLASRGRCIIVGRGSAQILPVSSTLRVRLIGPVEDRITTMQHALGCSRDEAARHVEKTDSERKRFVEAHFRKDPTNLHAYDLVLNTARLSVQHCADLIIQAMHHLQTERAMEAPGLVHA